MMDFFFNPDFKGSKEIAFEIAASLNRPWIHQQIACPLGNRLPKFYDNRPRLTSYAGSVVASARASAT
jgi:hypothetical protein